MSQPLAPTRHRAQALADAGDPAQAAALLEHAVELGKVNLGEDDPDVLATAHQLATLLRKGGDTGGARRVLEEAYAAGQWRLGDTDPLILAVSYELGMVAEEMENRHEARRAFGRVAAHGPRALGADHWMVTHARGYLGEDPPTVRIELPDPPRTAPPVVPRRPSTPPAAPSFVAPAPAAFVPPAPPAPASFATPAPTAPLFVPPASAPPAYEPPASLPPAYEPPASAPYGYEAPASAPHGYEAPASAPHGYGAPASGPPGYGAPESAPPAYGMGGFGVPASGPPGGVPGRAPLPPVPSGPSSGGHPPGHGAPPEQSVAPFTPFSSVPQQRRPSSPPFDAGAAQPRGRSSFSVRAPALFAAIAAVLGVAIAVVALVVVLADPGDTGGESDVPTLSGPAPTDVRMRDYGGSVQIFWSDPANGKASFMVTGGQAGSQLRPMGQVGPATTSFPLNGLNAELDYCFAVVAVYSATEFSTSPQICTSREQPDTGGSPGN